MIHVKLNDGTERMLDEAEVTFVWKDADGAEHSYDLASVEKLVLIEPELFLAPGVLGGGFPVVGLALRDASDLSIETPLPLEFALDLAKRLPLDVIEAQHMSARQPVVARAMPPKPPSNGAAA